MVFIFNTIIFVICLTKYCACKSQNESIHAFDIRRSHNLLSRKLESSDSKPTVKIVAHDSIKGYLNWNQDWFKNAALNQCNTRCVFSDDKLSAGTADVVLFNAPTYGHSHPSRPASRNPKSMYALISLEQPKYAKVLSNTKELQHFDLIATYSLKPFYPGTNIPNMPLTYYPLHILAPEAVMQPPRPFNEKTGYGTGVAVAVFTSNCHNAGATGRYKYVEELMAAIEVHSYGKCFNNRKEPEMPDDPAWPPIAQRRARKVKVLSHYKFYLAFENLAVEDYVSEKIYEGLFAGSVPVYRGTSSVYKYMPSNSSFIDANDMTASELASLLKTLSSDEQLYNRYMQFKTQPLAKSFSDLALLSYTHPNVLCRMCEYGLAHREGKTTGR